MIVGGSARRKIAAATFSNRYDFGRVHVVTTQYAEAGELVSSALATVAARIDDPRGRESGECSLHWARLHHRHCPTLFTPGGTQLPSMMEFGLSLGQYIRNVRLKSPSGAGSQFASLSMPGESF